MLVWDIFFKKDEPFVVSRLESGLRFYSENELFLDVKMVFEGLRSY